MHLSAAKGRNSKLEDRWTEIIQTETKRGKNRKRTECSGKNTKLSNIHKIRMPEGK